MKLQSKQLHAFTMALMLFSLLPACVEAQLISTDAQQLKPKRCTIYGGCPRFYLCILGECVYMGGGFLSDADEVSNHDDTDSPFIRYWLPSDAAVSISVYDVTGQLIRTLVDEWMPGGDHQLAWNVKDDIGNTLNPGVYLLTLQAGDMKETTRVMAYN